MMTKPPIPASLVEVSEVLAALRAQLPKLQLRTLHAWAADESNPCPPIRRLGPRTAVMSRAAVEEWLPELELEDPAEAPGE